MFSVSFFGWINRCIFLEFFSRQSESGEEELSHQMVNLMKRAKALRFYGLMGKRSGTEKLTCDKENMNRYLQLMPSFPGLKKPFQVNRRK